MKTLKIFLRDLKLTLRDFMSLWIIIIPIAMAALISIATPGISDSFLSVALPSDAQGAQVSFYEKYAAVQQFGTQAEIEKRVMERDMCFGILPNGAGEYYYIMSQGNEPSAAKDAIKLLKTYEEHGEMPVGNVTFTDFGRTTPPLKTMLITAMLILVTILSGMIISLNIVDEKSDMTIRAMKVAPVKTTSFVLGKSLIGFVYTIVCGFAILMVSGYLSQSVLQIMMVLLASAFISFVVGFLVGLTSDDFIAAAGNVKIIMLPAFASILVTELCAAKWHPLVWWSPFYWSYDAIKGLLTQTATISRVLFDCGIVVAIAIAIYLILLPKVKRELR